MVANMRPAARKLRGFCALRVCSPNLTSKMQSTTEGSVVLLVRGVLPSDARAPSFAGTCPPSMERHHFRAGTVLSDTFYGAIADSRPFSTSLQPRSVLFLTRTVLLAPDCMLMRDLVVCLGC